jgi:hypothetical protein
MEGPARHITGIEPTICQSLVGVTTSARQGKHNNRRTGPAPDQQKSVEVRRGAASMPGDRFKVKRQAGCR